MRKRIIGKYPNWDYELIIDNPMKIDKHISELDLINYHQDLRDEEAARLWSDILSWEFPGIMELKVWYEKGQLKIDFTENLYTKEEVNNWLSKIIREFRV